MEVLAVSIDNNTWRWRIADATGKTVAESDRTFQGIEIALAFGKRRVDELTQRASHRRAS
jgi:hypothetical protein